MTTDTHSTSVGEPVGARRDEQTFGSRSLGHEVPRVPRRYGQWAGAVLFVLAAVLAAGWLWQQKSNLEEILVVSQPMPVGAVIAADDLNVVEVAGVKDAVLSSDSASVIGKTATVGLVKGQVLTPDMVTSDQVPGPGERVVGMELDAAHAPTGLAPGDVVSVQVAPPSGDPGAPDQLDDPEVLADRATIVAAVKVEGAGTRLSLLVPQAVAVRVAAYAAAGRVALVQAPVGGDD